MDRPLTAHWPDGSTTTVDARHAPTALAAGAAVTTPEAGPDLVQAAKDLAASTADQADPAPTPWRTVRNSADTRRGSRRHAGLVDLHYFRNIFDADEFAYAHGEEPAWSVAEPSQGRIWRVTLPAGAHPGGPDLAHDFQPHHEQEDQEVEPVRWVRLTDRHPTAHAARPGTAAALCGAPVDGAIPGDGARRRCTRCERADA